MVTVFEIVNGDLVKECKGPLKKQSVRATAVSQISSCLVPPALPALKKSHTEGLASAGSQPSLIFLVFSLIFKTHVGTTGVFSERQKCRVVSQYFSFKILEFIVLLLCKPIYFVLKLLFHFKKFILMRGQISIF